MFNMNVKTISRIQSDCQKYKPNRKRKQEILVSSEDLKGDKNFLPRLQIPANKFLSLP